MQVEELSARLTTRWAGKTIYYEESVDSTNRWAKELAKNGAPHGTLALCDVQTAGRGRMQRKWQAHAGEAVLMSLLVRPQNLSPEKAPGIVLLGALAVAMALEEHGLKARIKWPNDIVCGGKKLCGMLLEMGLEGTQVGYAVLGIGLNVLAHPHSEETQYASSVAEQLGRPVSREALAACVLRRFEELYEVWQAQGLCALMAAYCQRCVTLEGRVKAIALDGSFQEGVAVGVCEDGALLMRLDSGEQVTLHAGDVSVRGVMGYV